MNKICCIILLVTSVIIANELSKDTTKIWWFGKPSVVTIPKSTLLKANLSPLPNHQWIDTTIFPVISIGPGIQTITISLVDGSIGVFDILTPVNITANLFQTTLIMKNFSPINFCFWAPAIGFLLAKPSSENGAIFGMSFTPYQIRINKFTFGIGIAWINHEKVGFNKSNFSIALPLTYTVDIGQ
jgi:hypothetical protein